MFTSYQLYALANSDDERCKTILISILIHNCKTKPLDAYYIANSGALNLISFAAISENEKIKLLLGMKAQLKRSAKYMTDDQFIELIQTAYARNCNYLVVRALRACAFGYMKHRRFTATSSASKFMIETYFPQLINSKEKTEKLIMDELTVCPEITLSETFLQQVCYKLGYKLLKCNSKALNNIRQLSAGSKPYKIAHNIDLSSITELLYHKFRLKNKKEKKRCIDLFKDHMKLYSISCNEFLDICKFLLKFRDRFSKDECYAAFCLTGDSNLKGIYPVNFLNIMRRIWYMFFTLKLRLLDKPPRPALKAALESEEIRSYWERRKGNKPLCNFESLKAAAGNIKMTQDIVKKIDKTPIYQFLEKYYS